MKNPGLKMAVISAMLLGALAMPPDISADLIPQGDAKRFSEEIKINYKLNIPVTPEVQKMFSDIRLETDSLEKDKRRQYARDFLADHMASIDVTIPDGWAEQVLLWSLKGKPFKEGDYRYLLDLKNNIVNILKSDKDISPKLIKRISAIVEDKVESALDKFGVGQLDKARELGIDFGSKDTLKPS
jgi:hypothetical protein